MEVVRMPETKTDAQKAKQYRDEFATTVGPILDIMERARADGLQLSFNIAPDQFGRLALKEVSIVKPL